jgi:hypothetical protein
MYDVWYVQRQQVDMIVDKEGIYSDMRKYFIEVVYSMLCRDVKT